MIISGQTGLAMRLPYVAAIHMATGEKRKVSGSLTRADGLEYLQKPSGRTSISPAKACLNYIFSST